MKFGQLLCSYIHISITAFSAVIIKPIHCINKINYRNLCGDYVWMSIGHQQASLLIFNNMSLNLNPLHLIERHYILAAIINTCSGRIAVTGKLLRNLQAAIGVA